MKELNRLAEEWLERADDDLSYARVGFKETQLYANICFSCQQAFEKYLKAFLIATGTKFPKTHDLTILLGLCIQKDPAFAEFEEAASVMSPYGVVTRYPDVGEVQFSKYQAEEALKAVEKIASIVKSKLN